MWNLEGKKKKRQKLSEKEKNHRLVITRGRGQEEGELEECGQSVQAFS